jgi:hypothetical protein
MNQGEMQVFCLRPDILCQIVLAANVTQLGLGSLECLTAVLRPKL